jgi:cold shock CspA family protein
MPIGTVKWVDQENGFIVSITRDPGQGQSSSSRGSSGQLAQNKNDCNVPIRSTAFPPGAWVNEGQMVSYDVIQGTKGPHAANIRLVINTTPKASSSLGR